MAQLLDDLKKQATQIKLETEVGENSATRIGTMFEDCIQYFDDNQTVGEKLVYNGRWESIDFSYDEILKIVMYANIYPIRYKILHMGGSGNILAGYIDMIGDVPLSAGNVLTQLFYTQMAFSNGKIGDASDGVTKVLCRKYNLTQKAWSAWELYYSKGIIDNINSEIAKRELYKIERDVLQESRIRNFGGEDDTLTVSETDTWAGLYRLLPANRAYFGVSQYDGGIYVQEGTEWLLRTVDGGIKSFNSGGREIGFRILYGTHYNQLTIKSSHDFSVDEVTMRFKNRPEDPKRYLKVTKQESGYFDNEITIPQITSPIKNDDYDVIIKVQRYTIIQSITARWKLSYDNLIFKGVKGDAYNFAIWPNSNRLYIGDSNIIDDAVSTSKIFNNSVTEEKLSSGVRTKLNSAGVIADNAVTTEKIADGAVTEQKLSTDVQTKINGSYATKDDAIKTLSATASADKVTITGKDANGDTNSAVDIPLCNGIDAAGLILPREKGKLADTGISEFGGFVSGVKVETVSTSQGGTVMFDTAIKEFLLRVGPILAGKYYSAWKDQAEYRNADMSDFDNTGINRHRIFVNTMTKASYYWNGTDLVCIGNKPYEVTDSWENYADGKYKLDLDSTYLIKASDENDALAMCIATPSYAGVSVINGNTLGDIAIAIEDEYVKVTGSGEQKSIIIRRI